MPSPDQVPQYFCAGLQGVADEGGVTMLTFATFEPSDDHKTRTYRPNIRIVMSDLALAQMLDFLTKYKATPRGPAMPMPTQSH